MPVPSFFSPSTALWMPACAQTGAAALLGAEHDASARQIVGRQLNRHLVPGQDADVVHAHLAGDMSQSYMAVLQLHANRRVRQGLADLARHLDRLFLGHAPPLT